MDKDHRVGAFVYFGHMSSFYAPNFEDEEAYWFGPVHPYTCIQSGMVRAKILNLIYTRDVRNELLISIWRLQISN